MSRRRNHELLGSQVPDDDAVSGTKAKRRRTVGTALGLQVKEDREATYLQAINDRQR